MEPMRTTNEWSNAPGDPRRVAPELRRKYDVRGPRYTSYPAANHFGPIDRNELVERWRARNGLSGDPGLSLYLHIPFCESRCLYCGCHTFVCSDRDIANNYVTTLLREMDLAAEVVDAARPVHQVALGGGTPNFLDLTTLQTLLDAIASRWKIQEDAELSVEIDPRSVTEEQLEVFFDHGFKRYSLGIQDFSPDVLERVGRRQDGLEVEHVVAHLRAHGCDELNFDLIYGLPGQTLATAEDTARHVLALWPSRVALYSYAHVPWIRPHQEVLAKRGLPDPGLKTEIFWTIADRLLDAGYCPIGMDHFALPQDPLARALSNRTLRRNFMGYSVGRGLDILGFGASAISSIGSTYSQNDKELETYVETIEAGHLPVSRGHLLSPDDELRRELLLELFCTFQVDLEQLSQRLDVDVVTVLAEDLERMTPMIEDGLLTWNGKRIDVTDSGRFFIRNICMNFDKYLEKKRTERVYSRTV